jgi:predicted dehydrogenase
MVVLVVGLGSMGRRRIRLLKRFDQVTDIIGVDSRKERRQKASEILDAHVCESIEEAVDKHPDIECAFVCTSPLSHTSIIKTALNHGFHVFTEINLVPDGYEDNLRLAKEKGKILFLSSTFFYREEIQYIRKKIAGKTRLNYVYHIGQYLPNWHPWENYKDFFVGDKRTNGCREIMAIELPWLIGTFGKVIDFNVVSDNITELNIQYKDNYMILLQHENGNKGTLIVDIVSPKAVRNLEIYGENVYYSWNGSPTTLEEFNQDTKLVEKVELYENVEHIEGYGSFITENAYQNEIKEFIDVVKGKRKPLYGFEEDLQVLRMIDKIEEI